jgi:hypothetical protein
MKTDQYDKGFEAGRCSLADELESAIGHVASDMDIGDMLRYVKRLVLAAKAAGIDLTKET